MPTNFGSTPYSSETLPANTFPVAAVFVPNTASGNLTATAGGPASTDSNGYTSAPVAVYMYDGNNVTLGTTTDASSANTLIGLTKAIKANTASVTIGSLPALPAGSNTIGNVGLVAGSALIGSVELVDSGGTNKASISAGGAIKVDGSAITQPVSGTVTANAGSGTFTVTGTVTANVGTTNGLALDTSVNGLLVSQGSTTSGEKGPLIQGAVTTAAPSYTTGQTSPISLTTAGAVRVDASATTQPVSGTVTANQGGSWTVTANAGTNLNTSALALDTSVNGILISQGSTTSGEKGPLIQGAVTTNAPSYTTAQTSPLSLDTSGLLRASLKDTPSNTNNLNINLAASAATVTVSGTVTANQGGAPWSDNLTQVGGSAVSLGSKTSANSIPVVVASDQAAVPVSQSGTWTVQPGNTANTTPWLVQEQAGTSGGSTPSHTMSAASTNPTSLKASAGQVYGLSLSNNTSGARFFKLYNKASAPTVGTDTPISTIQIPGNATVIRVYPVGLKFSTGIAWAATGGIADGDATSIGANDLSIDIDYQ